MKIKYFKYIIGVVLVVLCSLYIYKGIEDRKILDLSRQDLSELPVIPDYVEELDLSHNKLSSIDVNRLPRGLKVLNLSYNDLEEIPMLSDFSIEKLVLSNNRRSLYMDKTLVLINPALKYLDLSNNRMGGTARIFDSSLETVILSGNYIRGFYMNTPLKSLDISDNQLEQFYVPTTQLEMLNVSNNQFYGTSENSLLYTWLIDKPDKKTKVITDLALDSITYNNGSAKISPNKVDDQTTTEDGVASAIYYKRDSVHLVAILGENNIASRIEIFKRGEKYKALLSRKDKEAKGYSGKGDSDSIVLTGNDFKDTSTIKVLLSKKGDIASIVIDGKEVDSFKKATVGNAITARIYKADRHVYFSRGFTYPIISTTNVKVDNKINVFIEQLSVLRNGISFVDMDESLRLFPQLLLPAREEDLSSLSPIQSKKKVNVVYNRNGILTLEADREWRDKVYEERHSSYDIYSFKLSTGEILTLGDCITDSKALHRMVCERVLNNQEDAALRSKFYINVKPRDIILKDRVAMDDTNFRFYVMIYNNGYMQNQEVWISKEELKKARLLKNLI